MNFTSVNDIAAIVKKSRKQHNWTQADLAMRAGVSRDWLISLEKAKPSLELALVLRTLKALGVRLDADIPEPMSNPRFNRSNGLPVDYRALLNENGTS